MLGAVPGDAPIPGSRRSFASQVPQVQSASMCNATITKMPAEIMVVQLRAIAAEPVAKPAVGSASGSNQSVHPRPEHHATIP